MIRWRIAEMMKARGWTAYRLAQEIGLTIPATYRLVASEEIGRVDARTLEALCEVFGVEPGELIERVPDKKPARK
jgi:DNA-binding Xre family transcriptional regulator